MQLNELPLVLESSEGIFILFHGVTLLPLQLVKGLEQEGSPFLSWVFGEAGIEALDIPFDVTL